MLRFFITVASALTVQFKPTVSVAAALLWITAASVAIADDPLELIQPVPVSAETFSALREGVSPFRRTVKLSDSIILTGIARVEEEIVATVYNAETYQTKVISQREANSDGWQLVAVKGDADDIKSLTAKIQIAGGGVISIRHEEIKRKKPSSRSIGSSRSGSRDSKEIKKSLSKDQLKEAKNAAINYKEGYSADGYGKVPKQVVQKLSKLSVDQRESINREMLNLRNQGLGTDQRRKIYDSKVNQALSNRR